MTTNHIVGRGAEAVFAPPSGWAAVAKGYRRWSVVNEDVGAIHTGFFVGELDPRGYLPTHVHSFETSFFVVDGEGVVDTPEGAFQVGPGDYGLVPVGVPHRWRNVGSSAVRWAELQAPTPRAAHGGDTHVVPELPTVDPVPIDVRDPRMRSFGNITPAHMDPSKQSQDLLAVSASMRTALLVYGGVTVKMMVDSDLGSVLSTMFMVSYDPDGAASPHDHPLEETYYFLEGRTEATFDGEKYELGPGDVAWAGVGCVHSFRNIGGGPLRWLETQAPMPPARHSYRFARDWEYLADALGEGNDT